MDEASSSNRQSGKNEKVERLSKVEVAQKRRREKNKEKRKRQENRKKLRETLGEEAAPKEVPKTLESLRERDVTMVQVGDEEVLEDEATDEMAPYFNRETTPKILFTVSAAAKVATWKFCHELQKCIPNSEVYSRKGIPMKKIVQEAPTRGFTDIVVVHEDRQQPNALLICHLPDGPTAHFKLSGLKFTKDIKRHGESTSHMPEVVLNNFNTRLGHSVARMLACLFPQDPQFRGRRVVTFHNQRDFIFFRHHRYEFKKEGQKAALLELGPRFTLKLRSLQKGTFDTKYGEYEWVHKRHEMETSRRRFFL